MGMNWLHWLEALAIGSTTALIGGLAKTEAEAWSPRMAEALRKFALGAFRGELRERMSEEWSAHLEQMPGPLSKLSAAAGFCIAGGKIQLMQTVEGYSRALVGRAVLATLIISGQIVARNPIYTRKEVPENRLIRQAQILPIIYSANFSVFVLKTSSKYIGIDDDHPLDAKMKSYQAAIKAMTMAAKNRDRLDTQDLQKIR